MQIIMRSTYRMCRAICTDKHTQLQNPYSTLHNLIHIIWHVAILCQRAEFRREKLKNLLNAGDLCISETAYSPFMRCVFGAWRDVRTFDTLLRSQWGWYISTYRTLQTKTKERWVTANRLMLRWNHFGSVPVVDLQYFFWPGYGKDKPVRLNHMGGT